jgi:hypothetical protein
MCGIRGADMAKSKWTAADAAAGFPGTQPVQRKRFRVDVEPIEGIYDLEDDMVYFESRPTDTDTKPIQGQGASGASGQDCEGFQEVRASTHQANRSKTADSVNVDGGGAGGKLADGKCGCAKNIEQDADSQDLDTLDLARLGRVLMELAQHGFIASNFD